MNINLQETIPPIFQGKRLSFEVFEHEPAYPSSAIFAVLNVKESLLLKTTGEFVALVLHGDERMDFKKIADVEKTKRIEFAKPEEMNRAVFSDHRSFRAREWVSREDLG